MISLKTTYLGLELKNPLVPAASPLTTTLDGMRRLEDAGAGAVTLFSLFAEQIEHEMMMMGEYLDYGAETFAEATSYMPEPTSFHRGPEQYLNLISRAKCSLSVPVIASLNGTGLGGWVDYAKLIAAAGADALELNVYWVETDAKVTSAEVEQRYLEVVQEVAESVPIPVTVKLGPYFSAMGNMAMRLEQAGAKGLVLFNRFYQPDFDIENQEVRPSLKWSSSYELRLPLHWIAILSGQVGLDLALSTGVHTTADAVKGLMAGAKVVTLCSVLLQEGVGQLTAMLEELAVWLQEHGYADLDELVGAMSYRRVLNPSAFERGNYMKELQSIRPSTAMLR